MVTNVKDQVNVKDKTGLHGTYMEVEVHSLPKV